MSVLIGRDTKLIVQGLTGREGRFHAHACREYGTSVVGGVTPGKGGAVVDGFPIFDTVRQAMSQTGADASLIFVPPLKAAGAIHEAMAAGIGLIVCITEGIPVLDMVRVKRALQDHPACRLVGPNCSGIISPGQAKAGIMPGNIHMPGPVGIVSRSGTLTYEAAAQLSALGIGQSTCIGIGGDPIVGMSHRDALALFEADPDTRAVLMIGEIGGDSEEAAARWAQDHMTKPVAAFIAGRAAPPGRRMGHAGAIIGGNGASGSAAEKMACLRKAGITVVDSPAELGVTVARLLEPDQPEAAAAKGRSR